MRPVKMTKTIRDKVENLISTPQCFRTWLEERNREWYSIEGGVAFNALAKWLYDQLKMFGVEYVEVNDDNIVITLGQHCECIEMPHWMRLFRVSAKTFHYPFKPVAIDKYDCLKVLNIVEYSK